MKKSYLASTLVAAALVAFSAPALAHADISGLGDGTGFTVNVNDDQTPNVLLNPTFTAGSLQITTTNEGQVRSVFYNDQQSITAFTASFTYRIDPLNPATFPDKTAADGIAFLLQNSPSGLNAIGYGGDGHGFGDISPSVAISLELFWSPSGTNLFTNGVIDSDALMNQTAYQITAPVDIRSGNPIRVSLSYDGATLSQTLQDLTTNDIYSTSYAVNLPTALGATTAFVGFTGSTGSGFSNQYISDFSYTVPEPASLSLLVLGTAALLTRRRKA